MFGPGITEGDRSAQYRAGFSPGQDGGPNRFAHRIHYQQALSSALRLDGRLTEGDDGAHQIGVNWTSQVALSEHWSATGILLAAQQVGDRSRNGTLLSTRASVTRNMGGGLKLGVEMFNNYGRSNSLGSFNTQNHTIGPTVSKKPNSDWSLFAGVQVGVSDNSRDTDLRLWIGRSF